MFLKPATKMSFLWKRIVITTLVSTWSHISHGQTLAQMNNLSSSLLNDYNTHTRPVLDQNQNVTVQFFMSLIALREFDEVLGKLSLATAIKLVWTDESLVWDPNTTYNIHNIMVPPDSVWKPHLTLANPYHEHPKLDSGLTLFVKHNGEITWISFAALDTTCNLDTRYFPYDSQTCQLVMYTYGYTYDYIGGKIIMTQPWPVLDLSYYEGHPTWKLVSTNMATNQKVTPSDTVTILRITITLERQPAFVIFTFLLPILVLALLNPLVFFLPTDSTDRLAFSLTILLALSFFMTILADYIPPNADPISMCAVLLMGLYLCSSVIVILAIVSLNIYYISETKPISPALRAYVRLCSFRCFNRAKVVAVDGYGITHVQQKGSEYPALEERENKERAPVDIRHLDSEVVTWKDVSHAFDKSCLVMVYIADILVMTIYLIILQ